MKKQLQIGFAVVVILLILESVRGLAGTLDQIEIRIVTQDRSIEVVGTVTATPSGVSMQPQSPTNTRQSTKAQVWPDTAQSTPTPERPEILSSSTPRATFTEVSTEKPARKKTPTPENAGATTDSPTSTPQAALTSAPTDAPLPTSAPDGAPMEATDALPTSAPTPASP